MAHRCHRGRNRNPLEVTWCMYMSLGVLLGFFRFAFKAAARPAKTFPGAERREAAGSRRNAIAAGSGVNFAEIGLHSVI